MTELRIFDVGLGDLGRLGAVRVRSCTLMKKILFFRSFERFFVSIGWCTWCLFLMIVEFRRFLMIIGVIWKRLF